MEDFLLAEMMKIIDYLLSHSSVFYTTTFQSIVGNTNRFQPLLTLLLLGT